MVVDHPDGLHERVTHRGADKLESAFLEVFAHGVALGRRPGLAAALERFAADKLPDIFIEASILTLDLKERFRVLDHGVDFEFVAHDRFVLKQLAPFFGVIFRDLAGIEVIERAPVTFALLENREPAQARLSTFQIEHLE